MCLGAECSISLGYDFPGRVTESQISSYVIKRGGVL